MRPNLDIRADPLLPRCKTIKGKCDCAAVSREIQRPERKQTVPESRYKINIFLLAVVSRRVVAFFSMLSNICTHLPTGLSAHAETPDVAFWFALVPIVFTYLVNTLLTSEVSREQDREGMIVGKVWAMMSVSHFGQTRRKAAMRPKTAT